MNIQCFHSSSAGNLYQIGSLLVEAGVSIKRIRECLKFRLSEIAGCLISHEHMDHAKGASDLMKAGVDLYMSKGTAEALGLSGHRLHIVKAGERFTVGGWAVMPFATVHDAEEPLGFLLARGNEKVLFATDTHYIPHRFKGLTHIMIEASYDTEILEHNMDSGILHPALASRLVTNHMSIKTTLGVLRSNDLRHVREIHLLHLSRDNADAESFQRRAQEVSARPVYIAEV